MAPTRFAQTGPAAARASSEAWYNSCRTIRGEACRGFRGLGVGGGGKLTGVCVDLCVCLRDVCERVFTGGVSQR